ncbi:unnamed protein product [Microthlaspi erraticum]|uniref:Uncharacterized protein n=1 Tax=Microthlaspi erraticum TaxID=1685480 RepID=A0A6D2HYP1_9BRAS|nr:unnamed protein product [Microthlaspi erraticum]
MTKPESIEPLRLIDAAKMGRLRLIDAWRAWKVDRASCKQMMGSIKLASLVWGRSSWLASYGIDRATWSCTGSIDL